MNAKTSGVLIFAGVLLALIATGCNKKSTEAQQRLQWNLKTLVEPYKHAGYANSKWDTSAIGALTEFARSRSKVLDPNEIGTYGDVISNNAAAAVQAGCEDPLVNYLYIRFAMDQTNSKEAFNAAFLNMSSNMEKSSYPSIRKFYADLRTFNQIAWANNYSTNGSPESSQLSQRVNDNLMAMLNDPTIPSSEMYDACQDFLSVWAGDAKVYQQDFEYIGPMLSKNWPNDPYVNFLKGQAYIKLAWIARGNGYADTVTPAGGKLFEERLALAENALTNAWQENPNDPQIAEQMLTVELGQGEGRSRMELWFNRAMNLNSNDYSACSAKLYYLAPKWYGSEQDQLDFGHECVTNTQWGGTVPLILLAAHDSIDREWTNKIDQSNYWKRPEVWPDIKLAYDHFFQANPNETRWYHQYALYAYKCGQWKEFIDLIPKLGPINYDYFGGKNKFDEMVQTAKANLGS